MPLRLAHVWWSIGAVLVAVVIILSLAPPGEGAALLPDKLVHFTTYFFLGSWFGSLATRRRLLVLTGVILLGGGLELLQGMTPLRQPEWLDFIANTSGALLALIAVRLLPFNVFAQIERSLPLTRA